MLRNGMGNLLNRKIGASKVKKLQSPRSATLAGSRPIRYRWWLFALVCLLLLLNERFVEPYLLGGPPILEREELGVVLIILLAVWLLAEILYRAFIAQSQAVELLQIKHALSTQLALAADWNSVVELILGFCEAQVDVEGIVLLMRNVSSGEFEATTRSQAADNVDALASAALSSCDYGNQAVATSHAPGFFTADDAPGSLQGYCLPLTLGERTIALLYFYLATGHSLSDWEVEIFNNCAPDMAIALSAAQISEANAALLIDEARAAQRYQISRNLHDALAQKLVYLRLKLDQYAHVGPATRFAEIRPDLEQMETIANESYELVRGTVAVLYSDEAPTLLRLLRGHSSLTSARSELNVTFEETGVAQPLPAEAMQQIFYMFGEALNNIERHAVAKRVDVKLIWCDAVLRIEIADDGRGFDTAAIRDEGHYGLAFMQQRAQGLGGDIVLQSAPGAGTHLTMRLPLGDNELVQVADPS
jgi:signal transduction histidine kinase